MSETVALAVSAEGWYQAYQQRLLWGRGVCVRLPRELELLGTKRAVLVTTRSLAGAPADRVARAIAESLVGRVDLAAQTPASGVRELAARANALDADTLVAFGGGSVMDGTKAAAIELVRTGYAQPAQVALPTTLSGAEYAHFYGVTENGVKRSFGDPRAVPATVVLDPQLTAFTPAPLWAGSGVKALDHAIEAMLAGRRRPVCDVVARVGIRTLAARLQSSLATAAVDERLACQIAAWQCYYQPANASLGLSHRIGHVLGGTYSVPHSLTSGVTLPLILEMAATRDPSTTAAIAQALATDRPLMLEPSTESDSTEAAPLLRELVGRLGLPTRLGELGIGRKDIAAIAKLVADLYPAELAAVCDEDDPRGELEALLDGAF